VVERQGETLVLDYWRRLDHIEANVRLQIIASLKVFDQIYIMTSGGPNFATRSILEYIYDVGFTDLRTAHRRGCRRNRTERVNRCYRPR
jgi:hypothetical protein